MTKYSIPIGSQQAYLPRYLIPIIGRLRICKSITCVTLRARFHFEITRPITPRIVFHSVQFLLLILQVERMMFRKLTPHNVI